MTISTFPNQELQTQFQLLKDSISQDGCSEELAVCDQRPLIDLNASRHLFDDVHVEMQIAYLYESMDNTGCDHPYTVVEVEEFNKLKEYFIE